MSFKLSNRDRGLLARAHPDLRRVFERAAQMSDVPFRVLEVKRSVARQRENIAKGVSWTMNSRHLTGHAVDAAPLDAKGKISWSWPLYYRLAPVIKAAADIEGVPIEWGGDWRNTKDGPHWQLPWKQYPARPAQKTAASAVPAMAETEVQALVSSRTMLAAGGGTLSGGGVIAQATYQFTEAGNHISSGTIVGWVVGAIMILSALGAAYARWDDAGRPRAREILRGAMER